MIIRIAFGIVLGYIIVVYGIPTIIAAAFFLFAGICWCFNKIADAIKWSFALKWYYKWTVCVALFFVWPLVALFLAWCIVFYTLTKISQQQTMG